jgi:uncharacterized protein (UPF0332 family)
MSIERDLSNYRMEIAERCLKTAKLTYADGDYYSAANRSYYCIFNCMRSVLALERKDFKKHSGVIGYFREKYIKTKVFETKMSDIITNLFELRSKSDYGDFVVISHDKIIQQMENAEYFLNNIKEYLLALTGEKGDL